MSCCWVVQPGFGQLWHLESPKGQKANKITGSSPDVTFYWCSAGLIKNILISNSQLVLIKTMNHNHPALAELFKPHTSWKPTVLPPGQRSAFRAPCLKSRYWHLVKRCVTSPGQLWRLAQWEPLCFRFASWSGCISSPCRSSSCKWREFL